MISFHDGSVLKELRKALRPLRVKGKSRTKVLLLLRKIIFYVFLLIYLILCPLIVARMLGFVFNPSNHRLVKTGLIYLSTVPPGAAVFVDGHLAHSRSPAAVRDLTPGKHFIRLSMEGYNDWERDVPVVGKKATVISGILMIPQEWPIQTVSKRAYKNIFLAGDDVLIATNPLLMDMGVFRSISSGRTQPSPVSEGPLVSPYSIYAQGKLVRLYNAPPSPYVLLEAFINDKHKYIWVNVKESPPVIEDISDLFPGQPERVTWTNADDDNIFAFYPGDSSRGPYIYRINIKGKAIYPQEKPLVTGPTAQAAATQGDKFWINEKTDLLMRMGHRIRIFPKEEYGEPQAYDIAESKPSTNMCFDEKNGDLFYLDDTGILRAARVLPSRAIL